jgi:hypothetical protein
MKYALALPTWLAFVSVVTCVGGCGAARPLFRDAPPVWQVADDRNIAEPSERPFNRTEYYARVFFSERIDRGLALPLKEPAANTNSLDELPDSTWFQNRIGVRPVSPAEAARGFDGGGPPEPPFAVAGGKVGGKMPGFVLKDATGRKFLIKFDTRDNPELHSAAGTIVNRIFWTLGYNVPSDHVFWFSRDQLTLEPHAKYKDALGDKQPMSTAMLDAILRQVSPPRDGRFRALASQMLDGEPKGGFAAHGTRADDANDRVLHQARRELRGLRIFAAWLGHTDMKEDNTLDMYVEQDGRRFLRHYLVDFDAALNAHAVEMDRREDGWEYFVDWEAQTKAALAFGFWKRPWEDVQPAPWRSVGAFTADPFDPLAWRETYPYAPFLESDAADAYWGAKLVMRFNRPLVQAIVSEGQLSEPQAERYLVDTLLARRTAIGRAYLTAVTSLDDFAFTATELCMTDLSVRYGFAERSNVEWLRGSRVVASRSEDEAGRLCVPRPRRAVYTIYRLRVRQRPPMEVHFIGGSRARILGIVRVAG